ncbi:GlsB/YeaQ/YmgE family stress response membrane protein [Sporosarcina sp. 6E9]|uniref:GlsB/YeaQ/YmgE family stress response membrane protein n=1 Tax=Sporosarcina sp. 6E9 TaxID=2819235 RepID=UPI0034CE5AC5
MIGGVIGWFAGIIFGKDLPGGVMGNVVAGIIGALIFLINLCFVMKSMRER